MAKSRRNRRNTRRRTMKGGGFFGDIFGSVAEALGLRSKPQPSVTPPSQVVANTPRPVPVVNNSKQAPAAVNQPRTNNIPAAPVQAPVVVPRRNNMMPNARRPNNMGMNRGRLAAQGIEEAGGPEGVNEGEAYNELMGRPTYGGRRRKSRKSRRNRRCY